MLLEVETALHLISNDTISLASRPAHWNMSEQNLSR